MWSTVERPYMNDCMLVDPRGRLCCLGDAKTLRRLAERLNARGVKPDPQSEGTTMAGMPMLSAR